MPQVRRDARWRATAGGLAAVGGLAAAVGAAGTWLRTATETGGYAAVSGFGSITGDTQTAGENLNDLLAVGGIGSYRPGLIGLVAGILAVLVGLGVAARAVSTAGQRHQGWIGAAVLTLCGAVCLGWGLWRGFRPGTGGILQAGEGSAGWGTWLTAAGGALTVAAAVAVLVRRGTAFEPVRRRGIQPR